MDRTDLFDLYRQLQQYVGWNDGDAARLQELRPIVEPQFVEIVDDFYEEITRQPEAVKIITGGEQQIARLKLTLAGWLRDLFIGPYDESFVTKRFAVGHRHVEIGLLAQFPLVALARIRNNLTAAVVTQWQGDLHELAEAVGSLNRILDLDMTIIEVAYQSEAQRRTNEHARLAMLGKVSAGIAHEMRNPLNAIKTSVYYLLHADSPSESKVEEHLKRIDRQVTISDEVITALSRFAKLPKPRMLAFNLCDFVLQTLEDNGLTKQHSLPNNIELDLDCPGREHAPIVSGDQEQLKIVFSNVLRNATEAMPNGGRLQIRGQFVTELELKSSDSKQNQDAPLGHPQNATSEQTEMFALSVTDSGPGISEENIDQIMEPLFSTKTKGLGLGLALSQEIMQRHGGSIQVRSKLGEGTTFSIVFNISKS